MNWTRAGLKMAAKDHLKKNHWGCVGAYLLTMIVIGFGGATSGFFIGIAILLLGYILQVGLVGYFLKNRTEHPSMDTLWKTSADNYGNTVGVMFLMTLYVSLWNLLFVIPGIIKSYEWCMVPYLLAEDPNMDRKTAFARSRELTMGKKMDIFILDLSFIGWHLLGMLTCGLVEVLYVAEYEHATKAELYVALKSAK